MLILLFYSFSIMYVAGIAYLAWFWVKIEEPGSTKMQGYTGKLLSVVIVVRNEEGKIADLLCDLVAQTYPPEFFEVLVVNDHSEDGTCAVVEALSADLPYKTILLHLTGDSGKKAGLELGIKEAGGEVVVVTDGDCRVPTAWLEKIATMFQEQQAVFVSGPVAYYKESSLFEKLQAIEFASLVGAGAALLKGGNPGMCNAANMAFSKTVYRQALSFRSDMKIPSGDDEFLLQAIHKLYPQKIFYLKDSEAVVHTQGHKRLQDFYHQRKRWAGKWRLHQNPSVLITALTVYFLQAGWVLSAVSVMCLHPLPYFFIGLLLKFGAEFLFLHSVLRSLGKKLLLFPFLILQLVYPFYVLFFGIAVNFGQFSWKGRTYNYSKL